MKKTNLTRSLLAACSIVALSAVMYGCSSSGDDEAVMDPVDYKAMFEAAAAERDAALLAQTAAATAQTDAETAQAAAETAQAAAETAQADAEAAQAMAESERGAANSAAAVSEQARMDADAARTAAEEARLAAELAKAAAETDTAAAMQAQADAEAAQAAAETAQAAAEAERDTANAASAAAVDAQAAAEAERDAAMQAQADAEAAQAAAEAAQADAEVAQAGAEAAQAEAEREADLANAAAAVSEQARMDADDARTAAEAARLEAELAKQTAEADAAAAEQRAMDAEAAQAAAETERDTANAAAAQAAMDQAAAETERDTANAAAAQAAMDQAAAEMERDTANAAAVQAAMDQAAAEMERDTANAAAAQAAMDQAAAEMERDTANDERDAALMNAGDAQKAAADAVVAQRAAEMARDAAIQAQMDAETAQADAEAARDQALIDLGAANADLKTATDNLTQAQADLTAAQTARKQAEDDLKVAQDDLKQAQKERDDALTKLGESTSENMKADRIARANQIIAAIGADTFDDGNLAIDALAEVSLADGAEGGAAVKRDAAGKITVDVNGDDEDEYAGGESTAGSGAWNSVMLTKTDAVDEDQDIVMLYTDIETPADTPLDEVHSLADLGDALADARIDKVMSSGFPSAPGTSWTYTGNEDERAKTVLGAFDGVDGQFTCLVATCTVATNADGELATTTGAWRFTPASPLTATVKVPDAVHAYFGWWLNKPKDKDEPHDVDVFAGSRSGSVAATADDPAAEVVGRARYSGPAAGKYATKSFTAGVQDDAGVGHFTATANLVANFGDATEDDGRITGSVTGFELDDTTTVGWKVNLKLTTADTDNISGSGFMGVTDVNFGGGPTGSGTWAGTFYDGDADDDTVAPGTAVGIFNAITGNADLAGAFGAKKQ